MSGARCEAEPFSKGDLQDLLLLVEAVTLGAGGRQLLLHLAELVLFRLQRAAHAP